MLTASELAWCAGFIGLGCRLSSCHPGPLGSGSLCPPSDIDNVGVHALAQGAWSASMALLDGKQPCQSPEQAALENIQRWLDKMASKANAEHANTSVASSLALGTGGKPPPMAAPHWAPDAEDEMAKQKK